MKKRIVSIVLSLAVLVGMLPLGTLSVFAEEPPVTEYYCLDVGAGAYIDTSDYVPGMSTRLVMDCEINNQFTALFGVIGGSQNFYVNSGGTTLGSGYGTSVSWADEAFVETGRHRIELDGDTLKINGVDKYCHNYTGGPDVGQTIYLFGIHIDDWTQTFENQYIRFYSCKIYEGNDLKREYVPAKQGNDIGVYDRVLKAFHKKQGDGVMVAYKKVDAGSSLPAGTNNEGFILDFNGTLTVSEDTTVNALPGQSAILIGSDREVKIDIKEGKTLTVKGGAAVGRFGGGAGIEVPKNSSLTVCGFGTLDAAGGIAADGKAGENGAGGRIVDDDVTKNKYDWCYSGAGGNGGNGGGGAGAGVGSKGGYGGAGGAGGEGVNAEAYYNIAVVDGKNGSNGTDGIPGGAYGEVHICYTLKNLIANGGAASGSVKSGGGFGATGRSDEYGYNYYYLGFGGGGGGAGGGGYKGAGIGTGGGGAGAGGGGGSGLIVNWYLKKDADVTKGTGHGGYGGIGSPSGSNGGDNGAEYKSYDLSAGAGGFSGNGGDDGINEEPSHYYYYEYAVIPQLSGDHIYNGKVQNGVIKLDDCDKKYTVTGTASATDVGKYKVTAELKNGCFWADGSTDVLTFNWSIVKQEVNVPYIRFHYNGNELTAFEESDDTLYYVENGMATEVGEHFATLTLKDSGNYKWANSEEITYAAPFDIHKYVDNDGTCLICGGTERYYYDLSYLDKTVSGNTVITESKTCDIARGISENDSEWGIEGETDTVWYVVDREISLNNRPTVKGNVGIILMNEKTLTANKGITLEEGNTLRIYAQTDEEGTMGILTAETNGVTAIGGRKGGNASTITLAQIGRGIKGGAGENGGDVYIYGGKILLKSTDAVCIGGGNGGRGGDVEKYGPLKDVFGGDGGNGGNSGRIYLYGGNTVLQTNGPAYMGGGVSGSRGVVYFRGSYMPDYEGNFGEPGSLTEGFWNVYGSPLIKTGTSEQDALTVTEYDGKRHLSVHYHTWESVNNLTHKCSGCGKEDNHTDNGSGVCSACGKSLITVYPESAPTCEDAGHRAYYMYFDSTYYTDAGHTQKIDDLTVWLNTPEANGGGKIMPVGHVWKFGTGKNYLYHVCENCGEKEKHTLDESGECTVCEYHSAYLRIYTEDDFDAFINRTYSEDFSGKTVLLMNDIETGSTIQYFGGIFDGCGHTLYSDNATVDTFNVIRNATITNLTTTGDTVLSAFANAAYDSAFINCKNLCTVTGVSAVGFVCFANNCSFINCENCGDICSEKDGAGFVSESRGNSEFINCINRGGVHAGDHGSGFVNNSYDNVKFINCASVGEITAKNVYGILNIVSASQLIFSGIYVDDCLNGSGGNVLLSSNRNFDYEKIYAADKFRGTIQTYNIEVQYVSDVSEMAEIFNAEAEKNEDLYKWTVGEDGKLMLVYPYIYYPTVEPTCTQNGHIGYYEYEGEYYTDFYHTEKITDIEEWTSVGDGSVPATGHTEPDENGKCKTCGEMIVKVGDLNGDGNVDALDLVRLKKALLNYEDRNVVNDLNGDGVLNMLDFVRMKKYLVDNTVTLGK